MPIYEKTTTYAEDIEEMAGDEPIEAVVIGSFGWGDLKDEPGEAYGEEDIERKTPVERMKVLTWEQARPMLDYLYDDGYGAPKVDAIHVWTPNRVIFGWQYDGATGLSYLPRNPTADLEPHLPGG